MYALVCISASPPGRGVFKVKNSEFLSEVEIWLAGLGGPSNNKLAWTCLGPKYRRTAVGAAASRAP